MTREATHRYSRLSILMHWLMLVLLIAVYACIELRGFYPKGSDARELLKTWHFMLGLSVFSLLWLRIVLRWLSPVLPIEPALSLHQQNIARLMQVLLYVFMALTPLLGWLLLSAAGKTIPFWGIDLPHLIPADKSLVSQIKDSHEVLATVGYFLIAGHALMGLFHHFIVGDNSLARILPSRCFKR